MMEQHLICATRTVVEYEYGNQILSNIRLDLKVFFKDDLMDANLLYVRAYDSHRHYLGEAQTNQTSQSRRHIVDFEFWGDKEWANGTYLIIIEHNHMPKWYAHVTFKEFISETARCELLPITEDANIYEGCDFSKNDEEEDDLDATDDLDSFCEDDYLVEDCTEDDGTLPEDEGDCAQQAKSEEQRMEELRSIAESIGVELGKMTTDGKNKQPSAIDKLHAMIGLERVKSEIEETSTMALFFKERSRLGFEAVRNDRNHMLFLGNPGTGKTTVAGLIGEMYKEMGFLSHGHTVVTNRSKLIGEYLGETESKVEDAITKARGGVLFIDEAYTLFTSAEGKDYGKQVLNALLPVLSEDNPDLIIILAGYEDKMDAMLRYNPGLLDRFPVKLHFEDYTSGQLFEMACQTLDDGGYVLTDDARGVLHQTMERAVEEHDPYFGNGRWVHNLIEHGIIRAMAKRVMTARPVFADNRQYCQIEACDVETAAKQLLPGQQRLRLSKRAIGFTA